MCNYCKIYKNWSEKQVIYFVHSAVQSTLNLPLIINKYSLCLIKPRKNYLLSIVANEFKILRQKWK